jgi:hypothetical protein
MALSDDELLDFDMKRLGGLERAPRTILSEHGDAFRYQLLAARWIQQWADRMEKDKSQEELYSEGYVQALREVIAHLRQGDFLPGGQVYELIERGEE